MTVLQDLSQAEMIERYAALLAENAKLKAGRTSKLSIKVSAKGAISIYGFGKWPVTLYRSQMERLLDSADSIRAFIEANSDLLTTKGE